MANPPLQREIYLIESWATDFLKLLWKFGKNLTASPTSIYQRIPPFCPKNSTIYRQFEKHASLPHPLSVEGVSKTAWDDNLAKLSLPSKSQPLAIVCSGDHFAVLKAAGLIILYDSTTFEVKKTLTHMECVWAMSFSSCSNLLVTYGNRTTKVWSLSTGQIMHQICNPTGNRALTVTFSAGNTELIIGSSDRLIRVARLAIESPVWSILHHVPLKDDTALDRPAHNMPWRIAFNSDASSVAISYRSSPLCVWTIDPPELIGRCMRNHEYAGNSWTVVDQIIWHPKSEEVLGLYMGGHLFRWNPYDDTQQELQAEASILACSPDGKFFITGNSNGIIKLYSFYNFALIYQLSCESLIIDICFSPDSKRLYDLRGQFCNVWEPNALIRAEETIKQDGHAGSEIVHIPTTIVSEAFVEVRDQITAIAIQFRGRYQAAGNEAGVVSVIDSLEGDHVAVLLWKSSVKLPIRHLDWSCDENYLACVELTGKVVVKKVQLENGLNWIVVPVFDVKLEVSSEGIHEVLVNTDGKFLMVKNGPSVTVWPLCLPPSSETHCKSITSLDTKWIKHPTDSKVLLAFSPSLIQLFLWEDLSEIAVFSMDGLAILPNLDDKNKSTLIDRPSRATKISSIFTSPSGSQILMDVVLTTSEGQAHLTSKIETSTITPSPTILPLSSLAATPIPPEIQQQIEIPLGILPRQRLMFLDKDYWICSWRLGAKPTAEKVQRYYFLPKDWLNTKCLELCALLADGRFLIPNNGELAIIKSMGISQW